MGVGADTVHASSGAKIDRSHREKTLMRVGGGSHLFAPARWGSTKRIADSTLTRRRYSRRSRSRFSQGAITPS